MNEIKLGSRVKDKVTGFTGIATGRLVWEFACIRIAVQAQDLDKDGKPLDFQWFDEPRLDVLEEKAAETALASDKHGPGRDPAQRSLY